MPGRRWRRWRGNSRPKTRTKDQVCELWTLDLGLWTSTLVWRLTVGFVRTMNPKPSAPAWAVTHCPREAVVNRTCRRQPDQVCLGAESGVIGLDGLHPGA